MASHYGQRRGVALIDMGDVSVGHPVIDLQNENASFL